MVEGDEKSSLKFSACQQFFKENQLFLNAYIIKPLYLGSQQPVVNNF